MQRWVGRIGFIALLGLVGFSLVKAGSPGMVRELNQDAMLLTEVACMACFAERYHCSKDALPADQQVLGDYIMQEMGSNQWCGSGGFNCGSRSLAKDQKLRPRYEFAGAGYKVCATFLHDSKIRKEKGSMNTNSNVKLSDYAAGDHCFNITPTICPKKE